MKKHILIVLASLAIVFSASAQKYGHLNSSELLISLPEMKDADSQLEAYQKQLISKGEEMAKAFQQKVQAYQAKAQAGELSQIQMKEQETQLQQEQQAIQKYEVEVQQKLVAKRQELYDPIMQRVQDVIDEYAKANGYVMIFDTQGGALVYSDSAVDLLDEIKAKL